MLVKRDISWIPAMGILLVITSLSYCSAKLFHNIESPPLTEPKKPSSVFDSRQFSTLGTGTGARYWYHKIPYRIEVTKDKNNKAGATMRTASEMLGNVTCVRWFEVDSTYSNRYVHVKDTVEGACTGGTGGTIQVDGCSKSPSTVAHEMMHVMGIGHEHQRFDRNQYVDVKYENVKSGYDGSYTDKYLASYGAYDYPSNMHYWNGAFGAGTGPTYKSVFQGLTRKNCPITKGDVENINFVTQQCRLNPPKIHCASNVVGTLRVGTKYDTNISFTGIILDERLQADVTGLPSSARWQTYMYGRNVQIALHLDSTHAGKEYTIKATFSTLNNSHSGSCEATIKVLNANYVCRDVPSTSDKACSGHGVCYQNNFPQCNCDAGYGGPFCEGLTTCPQRVRWDFERGCTLGGKGFYHQQGPFGLYANCTDYCLMDFDSNYMRRPPEISFWARFSEHGSTWIYGNMYSFSVVNGALSSSEHSEKVDKWSFFRIAMDWENMRYQVFVNGALVIDKDAWNDCSKDKEKCSEKRLAFQVDEKQKSWATLDRLRIHCDPTHVSMWSKVGNGQGAGYISSFSLAEEPGQIILSTPIQADYPWSHSNFETELQTYCRSTSSNLLAQATIATLSSKQLGLVIPKQSEMFNDSQFIACDIKQAAFSGNRASDVPAQKIFFKIPGVCGESQSAYYPLVKDKHWGTGDFKFGLMRPMEIISDVGVNQTHDTSMSIRYYFPTSDGNKFFEVGYEKSNNRLNLPGGGRYTLPDIATHERLNVRIAFIWGVNTTATVYVNKNETALHQFTLDSRANALKEIYHIFWSNSANSYVRVDIICPTPTTSDGKSIQFSPTNQESFLADGAFPPPDTTEDEALLWMDGPESGGDLSPPIDPKGDAASLLTKPPVIDEGGGTEKTTSTPTGSGASGSTVTTTAIALLMGIAAFFTV